MNNKRLLIILNEIKELALKKEKLYDEAKNLIQKQETINKAEDKNYQKLLSYQIMFENHMIWESRKTYFEIMNNFLNNQIDGNSFCTQIQDLRNQNLDQAREAEANLNFKTDFNFTSKSIDFSDAIDLFDPLIEQFDPNLEDDDFDPIALKSINYSFSENSLRSTIKNIILPEFLKYYNID